MKPIGLLSFVITAFIGLSPAAHGGSVDRNDSYYFPNDAAYDSHGNVAVVQRVQLALEREGYYVGDNHGNFCSETRTAVRRYQRDNGLHMTNKIDSELLQSLALHQ